MNENVSLGRFAAMPVENVFNKRSRGSNPGPPTTF